MHLRRERLRPLLATGEARAPSHASSYELNTYATLFLDMLGWGDALLRYEDLAADDTKALVAHVGATVAAYGRARYLIETVLGTWRAGWLLNMPTQVNQRAYAETVRAIQESFDASPPIYQRFSDCFSVSYRVAPHDTHGLTPAIHAMMSLFVKASTIFVLLLSEGIPIRGAIEVGIGAEGAPADRRQREVIGASLVKAYMLERAAGHPRIVIGLGVQELLLAAMRDPVGQAEGKHLRQALGEWYLKNTRQDVDGERVLDYLSPDLVRMIPDAEAVLASAIKFVDDCVQDFTAQGDEKHAGRYRLLQQYFRVRCGEPT